jgi:hypothetical protein
VELQAANWEAVDQILEDVRAVVELRRDRREQDETIGIPGDRVIYLVVARTLPRHRFGDLAPPTLEHERGRPFDAGSPQSVEVAGDLGLLALPDMAVDVDNHHNLETCSRWTPRV